METFDPKDWEAFRQLAHRMVDEMLDYQRDLAEKPAWAEVPEATRNEILEEALPLEGLGEAQAFEAFLAKVLPYSNGNLGPRFFGWVQGNGMPFAMMADMLASGMNPHMAGFNQAPKLVEERVVGWLAELMDFPATSSGLLMTGGSMANTTALAVARHAKAQSDIRKDGLWGEAEMTVYGSAQTHSWAKKAVELLGMGRRSLRLVPVKHDFTMDLEALARAIEEDRRGGFRPIAVLATAGTVNTGATDDLVAIAKLCRREELWMHVDGAFGALAKLSPKYRHKVHGLELADSLAFDLHKWMYLPFDIACLLVKDAKAHRAAFAQEATYIQPLERGVIKGGLTFADQGVELTRSFRALKAWMCIRAYGIEQFGRVIEQNIELAQRLEKLVTESPELELMADVPLNVVCFRVIRPGLDTSELNALNKEVLYRIQEQGLAVPSSTEIGGKFCLRACIVSHRTTEADIDALVRDVLQIASQID